MDCVSCAGPSSESDPSECGFSAMAKNLLHAIRMPAVRRTLVPIVLRDLELALQMRWPDCRAVLFGSIAMELDLSDSDIDVIITLPNHIDTSLDAELVTETSHILHRYPELFYVEGTKVPDSSDTKMCVPISMVTHLRTNFKVDISFNTNGIQYARFIRYLLNLDERVMNLVKIVKYWARLHKLTAPTMLRSRGIVVLAIFFLQQKKVLPSAASLQNNAEKFFIDEWNIGFTEDFRTRNDDSLCSLLGGFFKYYNEFDFSKYIISPYAGRPIAVELFKDLNTVPDEFGLYKTNVRLNIKKPLNLITPIVQDIFEHNRNVVGAVGDNGPDSVFVKSFQDAVMKFQNSTSCRHFLEAIVFK